MIIEHILMAVNHVFWVILFCVIFSRFLKDITLTRHRFQQHSSGCLAYVAFTDILVQRVEMFQESIECGDVNFHGEFSVCSQLLLGVFFFHDVEEINNVSEKR
jgi:hypothetical protein